MRTECWNGSNVIPRRAIPALGADRWRAAGHVLSLGQSVVCEVQGANLLLKVSITPLFVHSSSTSVDQGSTRL